MLRELVESFSQCKPGPTIRRLPRYLWRRLFTFNIDDALETLYATTSNRKQNLAPLNFNAPFEPAPERPILQAIHLHGWVGSAASGFVFSTSDYVRVMSALNPWMHLLSEILATEPFIIAGASLNEVDLEYYLSHRSHSTPRRGRGPGLLIEPNPDAVTRADCERHGLTLVESSFGNFMEWVRKEVPSPPSVEQLTVPDTGTIFGQELTPHQALRFFSDFELVGAREEPLPGRPSPFMYGREADWSDIQQHVDVERADSSRVYDLVKKAGAASRDKGATKFLVISDEAGSGKTTILKRVAHELALGGKTVLAVRTLSRIDEANAATCMSRATTPLMLVVDGLADHAEQIVELMSALPGATNLTVLGTERNYREEFIEAQAGDTPYLLQALEPLSLAECKQLVERYRQFGLVANSQALAAPGTFARKLLGEPVAVAICRILNDFRPLDNIVDSLWEAAPEENRRPYLAVAVAQHCYRVGLRYSLLQTMLGPREPASPLFERHAVLPLATSVHDDEFVVALNGAVADRILHRAIRTDRPRLSSVFSGLASAVAPHVNRTAIRRRTPEARLAGRLFDADKVVKPLLGDAAESFYVAAQKDWEWNSRYWEQRALLIADASLETAIQYARHAVAVERGPFALTTLGKLLLKRTETPEVRDAAFDEAFALLVSAIEMEAERSRVRIHPFATLLSGTANFFEAGGGLSTEQKDTVRRYSAEARSRFGGQALISKALRRCDEAIR